MAMAGIFVFSVLVVQAVATAVNGWAWSDNIGWIEMQPAYGGVFIDNATGNFSGYAWSDNIGWIDFAPTSGFPEAPNYGARVAWTTGEVSGWAKAVAGGTTGGWDGWIKMRGTSPDYGVSINKTTGNFSGYAWGSDVVGWVDFSKVTTSVTTVAPTLSVSLTASPSSGTAPLTSILTAVVSGTATGSITYKFDCDNDGTYEKTYITNETTQTHSCTYTISNSYIARVYVERGELAGQILIGEATAAIAVGNQNGPPVVSITANPNPIDYNTSSTLSWSVINADSCTASGAWSGAKNPVTGSESTGNLTSDKTYILTCAGSNGTTSKSVMVQVNPAPIPSCYLSADPSSGKSPLTSVLTARGSGGSGEGYEYRFDYTNDGTYDTDYSASKTSTYTYDVSPGTITAKAQVKDSYGTTATCTTEIKIIGDLSVTFTADPASGQYSPLTTDLTAQVSGTATGTINYTFWWNCSYTGTNVSAAISVCGDPNNPDIGAKYDGVSDASKTVTRIYYNSGSSDKTYTPKVIVERGEASPDEERTTVTVGPPVPWFSLNNSNSLHATIIEKQPKTTNETTITVTPYNYFDRDVRLSVQSIDPLLPGATYNFSDSVLSSSEYSTGSKFSVNLPGTATPGTYTITIKGDGGTFVSTEKIILNIESISTSKIWEF